GVKSPQNPFLQPGETPNLASSKGFEGMALSADFTKLYPMLEGPLTIDPDQSRLIINEFDLKSETYTGRRWYYRLETPGNSIGDMTPVNNHQYLVIERDQNQGDAAHLKKIFLVDFNETDPVGYLVKHQLVDLLNIADPNNLGGSGTGKFTFPYQT